MSELTDWIESNYLSFGPDDQPLQNILDELLALLSSARYKLRFLG